MPWAMKAAAPASSSSKEEVPVIGHDGKTLYRLDLSDEDPLSLLSYKELIEELEKKHISFILARVETKKGNETFFHYFDAVGLNKWVYGDNFLIRPVGKPKKNPVNNLEVGNITYYKYIPTTHNAPSQFTYLGSKQDLLSTYPSIPLIQGFLQILVDRDLRDKEIVLQDVLQKGRMLYKGKGVSKNFKKAIPFLERASQDDVPLAIQKEALHWLGLMYVEGGKGIAKDWQKAEQNFTTRIALGFDDKNSEEIEQHKDALHWLGVMYVEGDNSIAKDWQKMEQNFTKRIALGFDKKNRDEIEQHKNILFSLGLMNYSGDNRKKKDWKEAVQNFTKRIALGFNDGAPEEIEHHKDVLFALWLMYHRGGNGLEKDPQKAEQKLRERIALGFDGNIEWEAKQHQSIKDSLESVEVKKDIK